MQALTGMIKSHKGTFAVAAAAAVIIAALVAGGYWLSLGERRKAEEARESALAARTESEQARSLAAASEAAVKQIGGQAAPEFAAKATRALQAQNWDEAREAASTAVDLDPKLGEAWFEKGRVLLQAGELKAAMDCFRKAQDDATKDEAFRSRAGRMERLASRFARQQQTPGKLTMPQYTWLGQALRSEGEAALATWFLERGGQDADDVKAQLAAAVERLKKDNPDVGVIPNPTIREGEIAWDLRDRPKLSDVSALEGLPLTSLNLGGSAVATLAPLKGMPLSQLDLTRVPVSDLSPLQGMPLQVLQLAGTTVRDLAPLAGAPLERLVGGNVAIADLTPLTGMPLRSLRLVCGARDLAALRDMPLEELFLGSATEVQDFSALASLKSLKHLQLVMSPISDLNVLAGLPIEYLELHASHNLVDLSPLKKLPKLKRLNLSQVTERENIEALAGLDLEWLFIDRTSVTDLTPLKGMKLTQVGVLSRRPILDYSVLEAMPIEYLVVGWMASRYGSDACLLPDTLGFMKNIKTLKTLQFGLGHGDLKEYEQILTVGDALRAANPTYKAGAFYGLDGGQLTEVWMQECGIRDLSPLKGLKLIRLTANGIPVTDLTPLAGMALQRVGLRNVPATDLTPLKGMPLVSLDLTGSPVSDLTPVKGAPIEELGLAGSKVTDYSQVAGMKLRKLWIDESLPAASLTIIRGMGTLTHINGLEVGAFWRNMLVETGNRPAGDAGPKTVPAPLPNAPDDQPAVTVAPNPGNTRVLRENVVDTVSGFTSRMTGKPEQQKTAARLKWDAEGIEVVFDCTDSGIAAVFTEHDAVKMWKDDCVVLWLDPKHTHSAEGRGVMVQLSASGAVHDWRDRDPKFDVEGLKTEVERTATGWQGTIRVPWKGLGLETPRPGDVWGFNLTRIDQAAVYDLTKSDYTSWVVTGSDEKIDRWGHLVFAGEKAGADDKAIAQAQAAIEATHLKRVQATTGKSQDR